MISLERVRQLAIEDIQENAEEYLEEYCDLVQQNEKYSKALSEIKEIAKAKFLHCKENKKDCLTCSSTCAENRIFKMINEVENANE